MKILIVEDEEPKLRHIQDFLKEILPSAGLVSARSVRSAISAFESDSFDLILLDMSLPTFDVSGTESGGRPQGFGGAELMREMDLSDVSTPVVVLTGYEAFTKSGGEVGLSTMSEDLRTEFPDFFRGILHFNSAYGDWKSKLCELLQQIGIVPHENSNY